MVTTAIRQQHSTQDDVRVLVAVSADVQRTVLAVVQGPSNGRICIEPRQDSKLHVD